MNTTRLLFLLLSQTLACITYCQEGINVNLELLNTAHSAEERVQIYIDIALEADKVSLESAINWLDQSEKYSSVNKYNDGVYLSIKEKAMLYYSHGHPDSTLVQCHKIFSNHLADSVKHKGDIYNLMGIAYQNKTDLDSAFKYLNLAHDIYAENGLKDGLVGTLSNLGNCFYESGDPVLALSFHESAYNLVLELEDQERMPSVLSNYAMFVLLVENDFSKVDSLITHLVTYEASIGSSDLTSALYQNLGTYCLQMEHLGESEDYFNEAYSISKGSTYPINSGIYTGLGMIKYKKKKFQEAISFYKKALHVAEQNSESRLAYNNLAQAYSEIGNIDSAVVYWEKKVQLIERIEQERNNELVLLSASNLEVLKKEYKIELLEKESKLSKLSNRIQVVTIAGLILLVIIVIILAYLIHKRKQEQLIKKEEELISVNQKILGLSLQITHKNHILSDFGDYLNTDSQTEDLDLFLIQVKNKLRSSLHIDKDWENFELYFNDIHDGFYKKLKSEFPKLSNSELRLCSLSKLRFNIKEIASILNLSADSVKSSRYRVRKKLNLDTAQDLSDFLNTF